MYRLQSLFGGTRSSGSRNNTAAITIVLVLMERREKFHSSSA
jgi:hypothetical protein